MDIGTADPVSANLQLLRLLHLASPALPVGSFHFSQGLEYAVEAGWVRDERGTLGWIAGLAKNALGTLDLPILARLQAAWAAEDLAAVHRWNEFLIAARETQELRAEDRHMGEALRKILAELGVFDTDKFPAERPSAGSHGFGYASMFALACARWSIPVSQTIQAYAWAWAENQVLSAIKLVPLGQTAGQRILDKLIPQLTGICSAANCIEDDDLGVCAVMQAMASAHHELQYTRLFRS